MVTRRSFGTAVAAAAAGSALPIRTGQAAWPDRPVTVVVPYPPGGNNDILARLLGPLVASVLGQPVVVENRSGSGGALGAAVAARAAPDGYTLLFADIGVLAINPHLFARLPYDPDDFEGVARLTSVPLLVGVPANSPYANLAALLAAARARPDTLTFGSPGNGTAGHLATQLLMQLSGTALTHVPYRGSAPAAIDLVAGRIDLLLDGTLLPAVQDGRVRALATTGPERSPITPHLQTVAEAGVPGYAFLSWHGVVLPKGAPRPVVERLGGAYEAALRDPMVLARARDLGIPLKGSSAAEFNAFIQAEREKLGPVVRASGATVQ